MDAVRRAFEAVPRADFLPARERSRAEYDGPIQLGHGSTNSQPRTVAAMLDLLDVRRGDRVLDIGAGSGWTTALLGHLTGPQGSVLGLELEPAIAKFGAENVGRAGMPWVALEPAVPTVLGDPARAPYDRILVSADADGLPEELVGQLADDGRMVVPVHGVMSVAVRHGDDVEVTHHGRYSFVPLR
jgi:protein-L-isoaspartate(D-aspartate) O-methyltransferase